MIVPALFALFATVVRPIEKSCSEPPPGTVAVRPKARYELLPPWNP
jgi:hypothetical protein